jgi:hypothetical protein
MAAASRGAKASGERAAVIGEETVTPGRPAFIYALHALRNPHSRA